MIKVARNVSYVAPRNCWFCLHVGGTVIYFGSRNLPYGQGVPRLELFTDHRRFRWSSGKKRKSPNCAFDDDSECVDDMLGGPSALSDFMWRHGPSFVVGCYFTVGAAWVWSWFL